MSDEIKVGDFVDVTIKGVRQVSHPSARWVRIADEDGDVFDMPPQAAIERVAPATWPPQPGDLWRREDTRDVYFAADVHDIEETDEFDIVMVCAYEDVRLKPEEFRLRSAGRISLVHREEPPCSCDHHGDHAACGPDCECAP